MDDSQPPILQQVRANNMFYRDPWFDAVEVRRIGQAGNIEHAFAQLCLLFQANVRSEEGTKVLATMFLLWLRPFFFLHLWGHITFLFYSWGPNFYTLCFCPVV